MVKKQEKKGLERTYGNFEVKGIISDISEIKESETGGKIPFRSMKITLKTSEDSMMTIDFFGMKKEEVEIVKFNGKTVSKEKIKWANRNKLPEGYSLSQMEAVRVGAEISDAKKKGGLKSYVSYDAINKITELFEVGESIQASGSISYSTSTNDNGDTSVFINYGANKIFKIDDLDFESEKFIPYVKFDQHVIVVESRKEGTKLLIDTIIVTNKNGNYVNKEFVIDIEKRENFAKNVKKLKKYSVILFKGDIINRALVDDSEVEDDGWGSDEQRKVIKSYERYFEVLAADSTTIEEAKYSEDDFFINDDIDSLGEEVSLNEKDSIYDNEDDGEEIEDDDGWL